MSLAETLGWHYAAPYDFYDPSEDPPLNPERYRVVCGEDGRAEAFWYFDERYMRDELEYARSEWSPHTFRLYVASWNERAVKPYERLGFREVGERHVRTFEKFGDHEFMCMELAA